MQVWRRMGLGVVRWLPFGGLFAFIWALSARRLDPDFGWHYQSGAYILAHGVPRYDIFTYTAAHFPWINHEWLNDVVMYGLGHTAGYVWLAGLFAVVWVLALGLATGWRLGWGLAGAALAALQPYLGVRPVAWTVLGLAVTMWALERRRFWLLPGLFAVWANLHGGFVTGLAVVTLYVVVRREWRRLWWLGAAIAATLVNPYGYGVYVEIWRTLTDAQLHGMIVEWMPLAIDRSDAVLVVAVIVSLLLWRAGPVWRRWWGAVLLVSALSATRQLPLLVVGTLGWLQAGYDGLIEWVRQRRLGPRWWRLGAMVVGLGVLVWGVWWPAPSDGVVAWPAQAARALRAEPCRGNLFNHYSYGGYLIRALPGTKVYIDGRMPSWKDAEGRYLDRWLRVMKQPAYAASEFARYNVQCALIRQQDTVLGDYLRSAGWRAAVTADEVVLWRRD